jgi:hypothetical protein
MKAERIDINWHPGLSIYASASFLKSVGDEYGWIGGLDNSGKLRCILPYTIIRKAIFRMVRFRVETIPLGEELTVNEEKEFLTHAMDYLRSCGADMVIPATTNTIFKTYPDGAIAAPYATYIIDLRQSEDALWSNLNTTHRRKVRLATKQGVKIWSGLEYMETAYKLVQDTFKRSKMPFMKFRAFEKMALSLGDNIKIFVAYHQGIIQGCTVVPFSQYSAYYVYGGSIPDPINGATNLLHWEAIKIFREMGVEQYDFVGTRINPEKGSKQEGLQMYKQRFGGRLVQGFMWKYPISRVKFAIYSQTVRILRGGDIVDAERHKLKTIQALVEKV